MWTMELFKKTISLLTLLIIILAVISCDTNDAKKGKISGQLTLQGMNDYSGITVAVFSKPEISDKITQINQTKPNIGFQITPQAFFDHRNYEPLQTTTTNQTGNFTFSSLVYGNYIIVFYKEGWGFETLYDINLSASEYNVNSNFASGITMLKPIINVPSVIIDAYTFEANHCYRFSYNTIAIESSNLIFQANTKLFFDAGQKLSAYGNATFPTGNDFVLITASDKIYQTNTTNIDLGEGIEIGESSAINSISNTNTSYMNVGLLVRKLQCAISHVSYHNDNTGISVSHSAAQSGFVRITNSFISNNKSTIGVGVYTTYVKRMALEKNIYYNNYNSIQCEITDSLYIADNLFTQSERDIQSLWETKAVIEYNEINTNNIAFETSGKSNTTLRYNNITAKVCIKTYHTTNWYNTVTAGWTKANNNNFSATEYIVKSNAYYYGDGTSYRLDFENNYWGTTSTSAIDQLIWDKNDESNVNPTNWDWAVVDYTPYKYSKVSSAGIR